MPEVLQRCVECFQEQIIHTPHPFVVCEPCQRQLRTISASDRTYQYRKSTGGPQLTGRRDEIVRKLAQGRLDESVQVFGQQGSEWAWISLQEHQDFSAVLISGTQAFSQVHEFRDARQQSIQQVRSAKRRTLLSGLMVSGILMSTAWFGYQEGWFVVDVDPFAVQQGDDVPVPTDLLTVLSLKGPVEPTADDFWTLQPSEIDILQRQLQLDLSKNPRQGRELLLWLQTLLLRPNDQSFMKDGLFPASWLGFALSLEHPPDMGHRVRAMWRAVQGDPITMAAELEQCGADKWCQAMGAALQQDWKASVGGAGLVLLADYALHLEAVEHWSDLSERLRSANYSALGNVLMAEYAIQQGDQQQLLEALAGAPDWLAVDLWRLRTDSKRLPETVAQTLQRSDWADADLRTQGAWALEQSARWMRVSQPTSLGEIEAWMQAGDWLEGDFPNMMLTDRLALIHAQALLQNDQRDQAVTVLSGIQRTFDDDLLNLWQGVLWVQAKDLRNASAVAERLPEEGSHYWLLQVFISVHSQNAKLIQQSLDKIVFTDVGALNVRQLHQTWVPQFDWRPLLREAQVLLEKGSLSADYVEILQWLAGEPVHFRDVSSGWATGWAAKTQYALQQKQYNQAFSAVTRLRRLAPSEAGGEILSQLVNIQIGRPDIALRELKLFAQKERSPVWTRWLFQAFQELGDAEMVAEYQQRWLPERSARNVSLNHRTLWDDLPND